MRLPRPILLDALALSMVACAVAPSRTWPKPQPMLIPNPTERIQFRGFSLLPPNGSGWLVAPPLPTPPGPVYSVAAFGKVLDHVGTAEIHTAAAGVTTWDVGSKTFANDDDFLQF